MKHRTHLGMVYLILFGIVACKPSVATEEYDILPIMVRGSKDYSLTIAHEKKQTLYEDTILFLIDDSGSVDNNCGAGMINTQYKFVNLMLNIFKDTVIPTDAESLYVGVGQFADTYSTILAPVSLRSLNTNQLLPSAAGSDTRFSVGINGAIQEIYLSHPAAHQKRLVLLTDGDFSSDNHLDVEAELERQIYEHPDLKIYVGICQDTSSTDFIVWENQISIPEYIEIFSGMEDLTKKLYDDMKRYLPDSFVVSPDTSNNKYSISGNFTSAKFWYWNPAGTSISVEDESISNNNLIVEANSPYPQTMEISPLLGCQPHVLSVNAPPGSFVFISKTSFDNPYAVLSSEHRDGDVKVVNNLDVKLAFEIKLQDLSIDLGDWKDCFNINLAAEDGSLVGAKVETIKGTCGDLVCLTDGGDGLKFEIVWTPLQYREPEELKVKIQFYSKNDSDLVWESETIDVPVKFKADYVTIGGENSKDENDLPVTKIDVNFRSIITTETAPSVFLMTSFSETELGQYSGVKHQWDLCPHGEEEYFLNGQQLLKSELNISCSTLDTIPRGNACLSSYAPKYPFEARYSISTYEYVISDCKFDKLMFVWLETDILSESVWICQNLLSPLTKCEDKTFN